jgi:hypothetical protein
VRFPVLAKIALAALLTVSSAAALDSAAAYAHHPRHPGRAECLSRAQVNRVRNNLRYAPRLYRKCREWVAKAMKRAHLRSNRDTTRGVFAMALAHRFAPYGPDSGASYEEQAFQHTHECEGYMRITDFIYKAMGGDMARDRFQAWTGGAVGPHNQLWVDGVMLDATVGVAAQIKLSKLRYGQGTTRILDLHHFRVPTGQQPPPPLDFTDIVLQAVRDGLFRPEDELYTLKTIQEVNRWSPPSSA